VIKDPRRQEVEEPVRFVMVFEGRRLELSSKSMFDHEIWLAQQNQYVGEIDLR
jgi:seryl-tRNA synthetase